MVDARLHLIRRGYDSITGILGGAELDAGPHPASR